MVTFGAKLRRSLKKEARGPPKLPSSRGMRNNTMSTTKLSRRKTRLATKRPTVYQVKPTTVSSSNMNAPASLVFVRCVPPQNSVEQSPATLMTRTGSG